MTSEDIRTERILEARTILKGGDFAQVVGLLDSPEPSIRLRAIAAIRRRGLLEATPMLTRRLSLEDDDEVRAAAIGVLGEFAQPESEAVFSEHSDDRSEVIRRLALRGLGAIGSARAVRVAEEDFGSGGTSMKYEALEMLKTFPQKQAALVALETLLRREASRFWRWRIRKAIRQIRT